VKRALAIAGVLIVLGAIVAASLLRSRGEKGTEVYVETVERRDVVRAVKASGEIDPRVKVKISAHVIGRIERLYAEEGAAIERGQPFLELEREAFQAARDQWAAQLASARTGVRRGEVDLADAEIRERRAERLQSEGIVTQETLDTARLAKTAARLALDQAQDAVRQAQANLTKAEDDLAKTTIFAPLSGTVIELNAEQGEVVVSGTMNNPASVIGTIADLSEILTVVAVDETEIVEVALGDPAEIEVDAVLDHVYHGEVVEIGSSGFSTARQPDVTYFAVEVLLTDADERLRPGMSARAEIRTAVHEEVPVVPIQSVLERPAEDGERGAAVNGEEADGTEGAVQSGGGAGEDDEEVKVVFLIVGGEAERRRVETGIADETHVEITRGLEGGETVITGPYRTLRDLEDGDAVTVEEPDSDGDRKKKRGGGEGDEEDGDSAEVRIE
jgi:HlyD family secretion protein